MDVKDLKPEYYMYGNKGNFWNNEAHIAKSTYNTTLCGTQMLATNHCKLNNVQEIGCLKCINIYNNTILNDTVLLLKRYNNALNAISTLRQACQILLDRAKNLTFQITLDNLDELTIYKKKGIVYLQNEHDTYLKLDDLSFGELELIYQNLI